MIQGISIENFRVFHKTEINGFAQINLLGGKNNSGKTCLLEALYSALKGNLDMSINLRQQQLPLNDATKNLFYNLDTNQIISLNVNTENQNIYQIHGKYNTSELKLAKKEIPIKRGEKTSTISIKEVKSFQTMEMREEIEIIDFWKRNKLSLILSKDEQYPIKLNLSAEFDRADIKGESDLILKAIQIIDPSVSEIKTYATFAETVFLRRKDEKAAFPISNYGDALQKIMRYIVTIVNLENGQPEGDKFLLIDEIENGLHHTVQKEFWEMLFKLAVEFNIQIFATTHSREMIEAFAEIAEKPEFIGKGLFFEMFRHFKTNEILANKISIDALDYKLQNDKALRGE